jgi:hypothetical protein
MNDPKRQEVCTIHHYNGVIFEIMAYHELMEEERLKRVSAYLKTNPQIRMKPGLTVRIPIGQ